MCLKNVKEKLSFMLSLRSYLTMLYAASAFIILITIGTFLYWESMNVLYKADYQFLSDEADIIRYTLDDNPDYQALKKIVIDIPSDTESSIYRYFVRIVDGNGKVIMETPSVDKIFFNKKLFNQNETLNKKRYWNFSDNGRHYLLLKMPIEFGKIAKPGSVQILLDISHQHKVISDRKVFLLALMAAMMFALILGLYMSYKSVQSLNILTKTTKKITAGSLSKRIDPKDWPNELRALGMAFNEMLERVESSFLRLKQISSDLAHELRTPINNMIGETEITLSKPRSSEEYQNVLGSNLEELNRTAQLIENILFLARAENPEIQIEKKPLALHTEVALVCAYYQAMAEEKNVQIKFDGVGELNANSIMMRRLISNLLSNAIHYTPSNGEIRVTIQTLADKTIEMRVTDNGIGIAEEHLPKLFNRFYRVDASRSQHSGGVGLGLPLAKSIVDLHKGKIEIKSMLNVGTTIIVTLPAI